MFEVGDKVRIKGGVESDDFGDELPQFYLGHEVEVLAVTEDSHYQLIVRSPKTGGDLPLCSDEVESL